VGESRIEIPTPGREDLAGHLRRTMDAMGEQGLLEDIRVDEWWDHEAPEVWMRTTRGARVRWWVHVREGGYEIVVLGPLLARLRRPTPVRELVERLQADPESS
jgi:hypothetical protein